MKDHNEIYHKLDITIPFEWEEKPGAPKKDLKTKPQVLPLSPDFPAKYVASIPFKWEEKPGTPLRCFAKESNDDGVKLENKCLPLPPKYYAKRSSYDYNDYVYDYDNDYIYDYNDSWMWDFEVSKTETNESPNTSPPCLLLANGLVSKEAISSAMPLDRKNKLEQVVPLCDGDVKMVSEVRVVGSFDEDMEVVGDYCDNRVVNGVIRRAPTLGELIMLSRRRSFHGKDIHMRKRNQPKKKYGENKVKGCLNLGAYERIAKLRKDLLRLNLA